MSEALRHRNAATLQHKHGTCGLSLHVKGGTLHRPRFKADLQVVDGQEHPAVWRQVTLRGVADAAILGKNQSASRSFGASWQGRAIRPWRLLIYSCLVPNLQLWNLLARLGTNQPHHLGVPTIRGTACVPLWLDVENDVSITGAPAASGNWHPYHKQAAMRQKRWPSALGSHVTTHRPVWEWVSGAARGVGEFNSRPFSPLLQRVNPYPHRIYTAVNFVTLVSSISTVENVGGATPTFSNPLPCM